MQLEVGSSWQGNSTLSVYRDGAVLSSAALSYDSKVLGQQRVSINGQDYDAFVINVETRVGADDDVRKKTYQSWYVPYVGEIKTQTGLVMVGKNF